MKYFNLIRHRAGLPGITEAVAADRNKVRELIKHERRIEFACEGRRYHDLRRWEMLWRHTIVLSPVATSKQEAMNVRNSTQQLF